MYSNKSLLRAACLMLTVLLLSEPASAVGTMPADQTAELAPLSGEPLENGMLEANSNRQVHPYSEEPVESRFDLAGFEMAAESDELELWLNRQYGALRIVDKHSGYVWGSLPLEEAEGLNSTWNCYGNSLVAVECFDKTGGESRLSIGKDGSASYEMTENGFVCSVSFENVGIEMDVEVELNGGQVSFEVVEGSLKEKLLEDDKKGYMLKSVTFMPFLGSSYGTDIDGYILIPDGTGALIRFLEPANYVTTYAARIYGPDAGVENYSYGGYAYIKEENQAYMPIYGIVHGDGQNGFLSVVESGDEYASIIASPALTNIPYNWAAARFEYRQKYMMNINRKEGSGALMPQPDINPVEPRISFYFVNGDDARYDGMAVMYREMLLESGELEKLELSEISNVPMHLDVLGADKRKGFLFNTTETFTTYSEASDIVSALKEDGVEDLLLVYRCYTKNNEAGTKMLSRLGTQEEFEQLRAQLEEGGGTLNLYIDPLTANEDQITQRTEAANNLSSMVIKWLNSLDVYGAIYDTTYVYRLSKAERIIDSAIGRNYGARFAVDQLPSRLYSDFTSGKELVRQAGLAKTTELVEKLASGEKLAMYEPNQYLWRYASQFLGAPAVSSQLLYESDTVPFLQIVLSGSVEVFSEPLNMTSCSREKLLRLVEYGMAPSFAVVACDSSELVNTPQSQYASSGFEGWHDIMAESYDTVASALESVWGHSIVEHRCLETGLIRVEYDNGVKVYVNYTDSTQTVDGLSVEPCWFTVAQ